MAKLETKVMTFSKIDFMKVLLGIKANN